MRTSIGALRLGTRIQTRYVRLKMEHFVCSIIKPLIIPMVTVEYSKVDILMVDLRINCWLETPENALFGDYTIFPKNLQSGKFWLETRFRIARIGFNRFPSQVNLGITLMCAINNAPFNLSAQTLWLDVYFAGYYLNATHIWTVPKNWNYVNSPDDIHAGYFVGEFPPSDFGKWATISIDLGDFISKTLNLITKTEIKTIRVYGFIVFVECLGAYAEVQYDYVNTILK